MKKDQIVNELVKILKESYNLQKHELKHKELLKILEESRMELKELKREYEKKKL